MLIFRKMKAALKYNGFEKSAFLQLCLEESKEIRRYKKLASQQAGYDIGYDRALLGWIRGQRENWYRSRVKLSSKTATVRFLYKFA